MWLGGIYMKKQVQKRKCKYCGKIVLQGNFCCALCYGKWHYKHDKKFNARRRAESKKQYHAQKEDPEYKKKRLIYFRKWRAKNREHFNDLCRERNRMNQTKRYWQRKRTGKCVSCGKKRYKGKMICKRCFDRNSNYRRNK